MVINLTKDDIKHILGSSSIKYEIWEKTNSAYKDFLGAEYRINALKLERESLLKERDALCAILQTNAQKIDEIYAKFPELDTEQ